MFKQFPWFEGICIYSFKSEVKVPLNIIFFLLFIEVLIPDLMLLTEAVSQPLKLNNQRKINIENIRVSLRCELLCLELFVYEKRAVISSMEAGILIFFL